MFLIFNYFDNHGFDIAKHDFFSTGQMQPPAEGGIPTPSMNFSMPTITFGDIGMAGTSTSVQDQENQDPNESSDWLHRNDNYVRRINQQVCGQSALNQTAQTLMDTGVSALLLHFLRLLPTFLVILLSLYILTR